MAVVIRLRQEGSRNHPIFRIVAAEQGRPRDGRFMEILGNYDPSKEGKNYNLNVERAQALIAQGAKPSSTVASMIRRSVAAAG